MTKENNPDTHKLLEHLDVLVIEHNGKLQVFFKLPDLYRLFTSEKSMAYLWRYLTGNFGEEVFTLFH